jgi:hypothetical protein
MKYIPIQTYEAKQLSVDLLDDPDNFYMHNRRYAMSVILQFVYGRRVPVCTSAACNIWTDDEGIAGKSAESSKC